MGDLEKKLYDEHAQMDEAALKARKLLRSGAKPTGVRGFYQYKGQQVCIMAGRVVTPERAEKLADELRQEGRTKQHVIEI